jgi:hypothetical protein
MEWTANTNYTWGLRAKVPDSGLTTNFGSHVVARAPEAANTPAHADPTCLWETTPPMFGTGDSSDRASRESTPPKIYIEVGSCFGVKTS